MGRSQLLCTQRTEPKASQKGSRGESKPAPSPPVPGPYLLSTSLSLPSFPPEDGTGHTHHHEMGESAGGAQCKQGQLHSSTKHAKPSTPSPLSANFEHTRLHMQRKHLCTAQSRSPLTHLQPERTVYSRREERLLPTVNYSERTRQTDRTEL